MTADPPQLGRIGEVAAAASSRTPVSLGQRRTASPHEFYRYPARFSPEFVAAAIDAFSAPGDLVADYFVGGGTTLVEARLAGRLAVGTDINSMSIFVSRAKTRLYTGRDLVEVEAWAERAVHATAPPDGPSMIPRRISRTSTSRASVPESGPPERYSRARRRSDAASTGPRALRATPGRPVGL